MRDKAFDISKYPKYDGCERGLASKVHTFLIKKTSGGTATLANKSTSKYENISNKEFTEELQKPIIRKLKKRKGNSTFISNICGTYLVNMQLISKFNKAFRFLFCVIDIYNKFTWVIL